MVFACNQGNGKKERKKGCWEQLSTNVSHLVSFGFLSGLVPRPLARDKSNWSTPFRYFEHSCNGWAWAKSWHLNSETEKGGGGRKKGCESLTSMRTTIGKKKPYDRYDVRNRDCHATDAHVRYGKLSNGTSGDASNLLAQEYLELVWGGSSLE